MNTRSRNKTDLKNERLWSSLLLFGCFCVGYNISIAFHELGHVLAVLLDGGQIQQFYLNPFSWSLSLGKNINNPLFTAWGGVSFGMTLSTLPLISVIWIRRLFIRLPVLVTAACAFLINGIYLVVGIFIDVGDGRELIQYGVSTKLIFSLGLLYMIAAFSLWLVIQPLLGIGMRIPFMKRLLILGSGIFPYLLLIFFYNLIFNSEQIVIWLSFVLVGLISLLIMSMAGFFWARSSRGFSPFEPAEAGWKPVITVLAIGIGVLVTELIIFGIKGNPF